MHANKHTERMHTVSQSTAFAQVYVCYDSGCLGAVYRRPVFVKHSLSSVIERMFALELRDDVIITVANVITDAAITPYDLLLVLARAGLTAFQCAEVRRDLLFRAGTMQLPKIPPTDVLAQLIEPITGTRH